MSQPTGCFGFWMGLNTARMGLSWPPIRSFQQLETVHRVDGVRGASESIKITSGGSLMDQTLQTAPRCKLGLVKSYATQNNILLKYWTAIFASYQFLRSVTAQGHWGRDNPSQCIYQLGLTSHMIDPMRKSTRKKPGVDRPRGSAVPSKGAFGTLFCPRTDREF